MKLRDLGVNEDFTKLFLRDIFGEQQGTHLLSGLVDCSTEGELEEKLLHLQDDWDDREMLATSTVDPKFHEWFMAYQAPNMKSKMLKPLRQSVGLGVIPELYTNNPNEYTNARIKEKVDYKILELNVFCQKMKELVDTQTCNIERAFTMDNGPLVVASKYAENKENPKMWVKKTKTYKEKAVNRIHKLPMRPVNKLTQQPEPCEAGPSNTQTIQSENVPPPPPLSISWKDIGLCSGGCG